MNTLKTPLDMGKLSFPGDELFFLFWLKNKIMDARYVLHYDKLAAANKDIMFFSLSPSQEGCKKKSFTKIYISLKTSFTFKPWGSTEHLFHGVIKPLTK